MKWQRLSKENAALQASEWESAADFESILAYWENDLYKGLTSNDDQRLRGRIVNVSSIHGFVSRKNAWTAPYCAAKGGVHMMTKALANDWGKYDITVNCIAPGYFPSELTEKYIDADWFTQLHVDRCPKGRHGITGEMDGLCVYFASPCCSYTTGQVVAVDGGWTCN